MNAADVRTFDTIIAPLDTSPTQPRDGQIAARLRTLVHEALDEDAPVQLASLSETVRFFLNTPMHAMPQRLTVTPWGTFRAQWTTGVIFRELWESEVPSVTVAEFVGKPQELCMLFRRESPPTRMQGGL